MSYNHGQPPHQEGPYANTQGPPPYPSAHPHMGQQPYGAAPIIIMQQQQQQQQQQQHQVIVHRPGPNHALCCIICFLTSGLSTPCWIYSCLTN
ncbi:unnamed protein product [Adineta steineri]|uniref:Uncharacterized protein n=1 Tax=Adineta steineri TaxID=433720 RepID=A0A818R627_9BILA|nr:unnamed protein product [Adineta steineri]CAF3652028.1 unnamed protein product [Adineta steineri]